MLSSVLACPTKQWSRRGETQALFLGRSSPRGSLLSLGVMGQGMKRYVHATLGEFQAEVWEWRVQRELSFAWGYSTRRISIVENDSLGQPTEVQFGALIDLLEQPSSFREVLAEAILKAYSRDIRPQYLAVLADSRHEYDFSEEDLPELHEAADVWKVVTDLYSVWVLEDASVDVEFSVTFDDEHELHVKLRERVVERVWME